MKEVTEWNGKPRMLWVWDGVEGNKEKRFVCYISSRSKAKMTEESMFCDEKGKLLPRKDKFDIALYEEKVEKAHLKAQLDKDNHTKRLEKAVKFAERYGFSTKQMGDERMTVTMTEFPTENDWAQVKRRALKTCGKKPVTPPTTEWKHAILNARHSPIRRLFFSFDLDDVPYWLSNELCRHHEGVEKYVFSQRNDRQQNYDRNAARQDAPVNLVFDCNAEGLMTVMNKRLCNQASKEMRELMGKIKEVVLAQFPEFIGLLVPMCEYCGGVCHEMNPCGRHADGLYSRLIQENEMLKTTIEGMKNATR